MTSLRRCLISLYLAAATMLAPLPALADRCDDLAGQLKSQIDGLHVGKTAANAIFLSHSATTQLILGCSNRKFTNELIAGTDSRKPKPEFYDLVARASAIVFTIPIADTLKGVTRCMKRMGLLRRRRTDALSAAEHALHPHQNQRRHRSIPRQRRVINQRFPAFPEKEPILLLPVPGSPERW